MKTKTALIITLILTTFALLLGLLLAPRFPEQMAIHWNAQGVADGYGSHFMGLWFLPLMTIVLALILLGIPQIDPLKRNIDQFRTEYNTFIVVFVIYFVYLHVISLLFNLGLRFNLLSLMVPGVAGLFYFIGVLIGKSKRNYFIGIRTPWTLADDTVWDETHRVGARLFKIAGGAILIGMVFPSAAIWLIMIPILVATIYTIVYSYAAYRRLYPQGK